jgi:hypothetical protein
MRRRTAPFAILVGVAAYLAGQVLFNVAVQARWLPLTDPVFVEKFELLERHPVFFAEKSPTTPTRILVLGSSRSHLGVDARRFAGRLSEEAVAFNFATSGGGPLTNALYLRRLLEAGVRPDAVLWELHPALFCGRNEADWLGSFRLRPGEPDVLKRFGHDTGPVPQQGWRGWLTATHLYRFPALNRYAERWLPCPHGLTVGANNDPFGYVDGIDLPPHERPVAFGRALKQYADALAAEGLIPSAPLAVRDAIEVCQRHGVRFVAFVSPESAALRAAYRPAATRAFDVYLDSLDVPVLRSRAVLPDDLFADGHHLLPAGAAALTDHLATAYEGTPR